MLKLIQYHGHCIITFRTCHSLAVRDNVRCVFRKNLINILFAQFYDASMYAWDTEIYDSRCIHSMHGSI